MKENVEYLRKIVHVQLAGRCQFIATRSLPCLMCLITCKSYSVSKEGDDEDDQEQGHDGDRLVLHVRVTCLPECRGNHDPMSLKPVPYSSAEGRQPGQWKIFHILIMIFFNCRQLFLFTFDTQCLCIET